MAHCAGSSRSRPRQDHRPDRTRRQSPPLWAANPELHSKEDGTAQQSNRYMTETASYLTQTEGGGSISMHLRPHIKAYQKPNGSPMGVIKYLDPRRAPHGRGGPESYTTTRPSAAALSSHTVRSPATTTRTASTTSPTPASSCVHASNPSTNSESISRHHAPHPPTYRRAPRLAQQPIRDRW